MKHFEQKKWACFGSLIFIFFFEFVVCCSRSISDVRCHEQPIGQFGFGTNSAVAVSARTAVRFVQRHVHHLGRYQRRVQVDRPGRSGSSLGRTQIQTQHELRQTESSSSVSLHFPSNCLLFFINTSRISIKSPRWDLPWPKLKIR